jgi:hypothetical protein
VAVNGEVVAIEEFASAKLFAKVRPKLLRSYYVEALDVPAKKTDKPVWPPTWSPSPASRRPRRRTPCSRPRR